MATQLVVKREELKAKQAALAAIFEQAGPDLDLGKAEALKGLADTKARADEVRRQNDELTVLGKEVEQLAETERIAASVKGLSQEMQHPAKQPEAKQAPAMKSVGEAFIASDAFRGFKGGRGGPVAQIEDIELKTLMSQTAGWVPSYAPQPGFVPSAQRIPTITDVIPTGQTSQSSITYQVESTFTNNAAERAEGANNAGEAALALTLTTATVRQIPVWIPVTKEELDDVPYVQGYVNNRLGLMLRQRMSSQLLVGNGVPPNLAGIIGLAGVQTQAKGADPTPDAVYKAIVLAQVVGRAEPSAVIFHPYDWQDIRLLRTADGVYIWGSPSEAGPERIWGLPAIKDSACTENTAVVGDFANFSELVYRQGIEMEITDSHASLFIQYTLAIRAALRVAFIVRRPAAFVQVTGI